MANTQGLTDEEMLKSVNETVRDWSAAATASSTSVSRRGGRLAERLDMAGGARGRPSAKVIRKSPPVKIAKPTGAKQYSANADASGTKTNDDPASTTISAPPPVLKDIVERKRTKTSRKSKAASAGTAARPTPHPPQGFPSLQKPLGTFTPKHAKSAVAASTNATAATRTSSSTATSTMPPTAATSNDIDALKRVSEKEADQMLAGMSADEIRESARELRALLSPTTLAFLQNRKKNKMPSAGSAAPAQSTEVSSSSKDHGGGDAETMAVTATYNASTPTTALVEAERREKERVAKLLASVQTHDDMDAIYRAEIGEAPDGFINQQPNDKLDSATAASDSFLVACDLLRSTAPRQTLWAVRTVRDKIAQDYDQGNTVRLPANASNWPYPTLLPVSLRCLLDQTPNRVNGFALHTHSLEALYLLLRLRCAVDHDVILSGSTAYDNDDPAVVFQLYLGQDALPSPPLATLYAATKVTPLSAGEHENVAYETASSSATATQDGQKFSRDPLWTLLSQMRIIPRLAALCKSPLPEEALIAAIGILAMVAHRSPGGATAMVQHKSLLKDLASHTWDVPDTSESILFAVVRLWTVLARQSRTAATGLELPPWGLLLRGVKQNSSSTLRPARLQRWTLVLWRTLLRYGLAIHELEAMLTLAVPHVVVMNGENLLAADFFQCWSLVLEAHRDRIIQAGDDGILQHELRQLVKARAWLRSYYRKALAHLQTVHAMPVSTEDLVLFSACLRLCQQYIVTADDTSPNPPGEFKSQDPTVDDELACLKALRGMVNSGTVPSTLSCVSPWIFQCETEETNSFEAASAGFLTSFYLVLRMLQSRVREGSHDPSRAALSLLETSLSSALVGLVRKQATLAPVSSRHSRHLAAIGWRNRGRCVILELFRLTCESHRIAPVIRSSMGVSALSLLQVGEEALVDRMARLEMFRLPPDLRDMILGQLQSTPQKQLQLRHSSALNRDFFLDRATSAELQSLRSEADSTGPKRDEADSVGLPLGDLWLWKVLAGSASTATPVERIVKVLNTALSVIDDLEEADTTGVCRYAGAMAAGSKMYFLMNLCMQTEEVVSDDAIGEVSERLRQKYFLTVDDSTFVDTFTDSCVSHSSLQHPGTSSSDNSQGAPTTEEEKLTAALLEENETSTTTPLSGKRLRIVLNFVNDLCKAFCDYGAQYTYFAACLRLFLYPAFPSPIRCEVLRRLQGLLHLLSSPADEHDPLILAGFLEEGAAHGDILDALASCLTRSNVSCRSQGLVENVAIAALGKSLGVASQRGSLELLRNRSMSLHPSMLRRVVETARFFQQKEDHTRLHLSKFVISLQSSDGGFDGDDAMTWNRVVSILSK